MPDMGAPEVAEMTDNVHMFTYSADDGSRFEFHVKNMELGDIMFTLDFAGSCNVAVEDTGGLVMNCRCPSKCTTLIGVLKPDNPTLPYSFSYNCSWAGIEHDHETVQESMKEAHNSVIADLTLANILEFGSDAASITEIEVKCEHHRIKFLDPEFPPLPTSLFINPAVSNTPVPMEWRRPESFFDGGHGVFIDSIEPSDIKQGMLGDCWFMSSIACLAEFPEHVLRIFATEGSNRLQKSGCYKLRFNKNGEWTTVRIDDFFPCHLNGPPLYSQSNGNELWVLLIEKAYAKLHGCYQALTQGNASDGMMDLTGCPAVTLGFTEKNLQADLESGKVWKRLLHYDHVGYMMCAGTPGTDNMTTNGQSDGAGLVPGHAYSVLTVCELSNGAKLLRMRNPWGKFEWDGDWGDRSRLWNDTLRDEAAHLAKSFGQATEGTFWMSWADVLTNFESLSVCFTRGFEKDNAHPWFEQRAKSHFKFNKFERKGHQVSVTNSFILTVQEEGTEVVLGMHQEDSRICNAPSYVDMGITVYKIDAQGAPSVLPCGNGVQVTRSGQLDPMRLHAGRYLIMPISSGTLFERLNADRSHENDDVEPILSGTTVTPRAAKCFQEIFRRYDINMDGVLDREELTQLHTDAGWGELTDLRFETYMETCDHIEKGLTADGLADIVLRILPNTILLLQHCLGTGSVHDAVKILDVDDKGYIDANDLTRVVEKKGLEYTFSDIAATIDELDLNHNGGITADEIEALLEYGNAHVPSNRQHMGASAMLSAEELARQKFELFDEDNSGNISQAELGKILRSLGLGQGVSQAQFRHFLAEQFQKADMDGNGVIDWDEFVEFHNVLIELQWSSQREKETGVRTVLAKFGYDPQLRLLNARTFVISTHSSHPVRLQLTHEVDQTLFKRGITDQITACGESKLHNNMVAMFTHQPPLGKGIGLAAKNITQDSICEVTCEWQGKNCCSSAGSNKTTIELQPGESGLLHLLMQADANAGGFGYNYNFGFGYRPV